MNGYSFIMIQRSGLPGTFQGNTDFNNYNELLIIRKANMRNLKMNSDSLQREKLLTLKCNFATAACILLHFIAFCNCVTDIAY